MTYFYSYDEENFNYEDAEEAAEYACELMETPKLGDKFSIWEGCCYGEKASYWFDANRLLDDMAEQHGDKCLETEWLNYTTKEQAKELKELISPIIDAWADKHKLHPDRFPIATKDVKEIVYIITEITTSCDGTITDVKFKELEQNDTRLKN